MPAVLFVCLGNICRSPMADGMLREKARALGLPNLEVDSAGTAAHHVGEPADPRTVAVLRRHGADFPHVARQVTQADFHRFDLLLALDGANLAALRRLAPAGLEGRIARVLDPVGGGDVPDPWTEGPEAFQRTWDLLEPAVDAWLARLTG